MFTLRGILVERSFLSLKFVLYQLKGQGGDEVKKKEIVEIIDHSVMDKQDLVEKLGLFMFRDAEVLNNGLQF